MMVAHDTVGHRRREQRLDGAEDGNRYCRRDEALYRLPRHGGHVCLGQLVADGKAVADGLHRGHAGHLLEQQHGDGHHDDGYERARNLLAELRRDGYHGHAQYADGGAPRVYRGEAAAVGYPFLDEVRRHFVHRQAEEVFYLGREDGHGDTARKSHDDGIGDILDDGSQPQEAEHDEEGTGHERGDGQSLDAVLLDDAVDDDDERSCGAADLDAAASEDGDDQSGDDGRDDALLRRHARGNTESDGQRQRHDAYDDAGHEVGHKGLTVVILQS